MLRAISIQPVASAATSSFIFLHGLGDSGHGWSAIARELQRHLPSTRFIFPHAPMKAVTINGGAQMPAWYDIHSLEAVGNEEAEGIDNSVHQLQAEEASGVPRSRIIVGGFSQGNRNYHACIYQGGAVALRAALLHPVGGCVVLSSYLAKHASLVNVEKCPIFMAHGLHDPVVRYEYGHKSYEHLKSLNVEVEFHKYLMQHESCPDEISDMIAFLKKHLN